MTTPQAAVEAPGPDTGLDSGNTSLAVSGVPLVVDNNSQEDNDSKASTTSPTAELTDLTAAEFQGLVEDMANTEDTIPDADLAWGDDPTLAAFADTLSSGLSAPNLDTTLPDPVPLVPPGLENFPPDRRATVLSQINKYYVDWLSNDPRVKWLDEMPESQKRLRLQDFLTKKLKCLLPNSREDTIIPRILSIEESAFSKASTTTEYLALLRIELKELEMKACVANCKSAPAAHVRSCPFGNEQTWVASTTVPAAASFRTERVFADDDQDMLYKAMEFMPLRAPQQMEIDMQELFAMENSRQPDNDDPNSKDSITEEGSDLSASNIGPIGPAPTLHMPSSNNMGDLFNFDDILGPMDVTSSASPPSSNSAETDSDNNDFQTLAIQPMNSNLADVVPLPGPGGANANVRVEDFMQHARNIPQEGPSSSGIMPPGNLAAVNQGSVRNLLPMAPANAIVKPSRAGLARSSRYGRGPDIAVPYLPGTVSPQGYASAPGVPVGFNTFGGSMKHRSLPGPPRGSPSCVAHRRNSQLSLRRHVNGAQAFPLQRQGASFQHISQWQASNLRGVQGHGVPHHGQPQNGMLPHYLSPNPALAQASQQQLRMLGQSLQSGATANGFMQQGGSFPMPMQRNVSRLRGQQPMTRNMQMTQQQMMQQQMMQQYMHAMSRNIQMVPQNLRPAFNDRNVPMHLSSGYMQRPLTAQQQVQFAGGVPSGLSMRQRMMQQAHFQSRGQTPLSGTANRGAIAPGGGGGRGNGLGSGSGSSQQSVPSRSSVDSSSRQTAQPFPIANRGRAQTGRPGQSSDPVVEMQRLLENHRRDTNKA